MPVPHTAVHANATSHGRLFTDTRTVSGCGETYVTLNSSLIHSDADRADNISSARVRLYKGVGLYSQNQPDKNQRSLGWMGQRVTKEGIAQSNESKNLCVNNSDTNLDRLWMQGVTAQSDAPT